MNITIKDVTFNYGSRQILDRVYLEVNPGEIASIVGPNGAGKTTFLKCIDRILKPSRGAILVDGEDINSLSRKELARTLAYVPQGQDAAFSMTVFEYVLLGRVPYLGWNVENRDLDVVADALSLLNLEAFAKRHLDELSGGEKQKVTIARALAQEPSVLLLDEPIANLDITHQLEALEIIGGIASAKGIAVIMVLHDLNLAYRFSSKVLMLSGGRVFACGNPPEVLTPQNIGEVYGVEVSVVRIGSEACVIPIRPRSLPLKGMRASGSISARGVMKP